MPTYAIGDVQGCYRELQDLLATIAFGAQDSVWLTGDIVNRGPQSLETLRFIKALGAQAITVLGNHDLHLLTVAANAVPLKQKDTLQDVLAAKDREELLDWLRQLPLVHYDKTLNYLLVHAGIPPQWNITSACTYAHEVEKVLRSDDAALFLAHMYGEQPSRWSDALQGWGRLRYITNALTRMRFCTAEGELEFHHKQKNADVPEGFMPWFEHTQFQALPYQIIFGHWAALEGKTYHPRIHAIDTGCAWGNRLTALRLEDGKRFSVAARL